MFESVAAYLASWLTPPSLFIFLNIVIATILNTSRYSTSPQTQIHDSISTQLAPSPSLLDRVRSFNNYYYYESEQTTDSTQLQLVRTPSFLERVKSFDFSHYKHQPTHPETEYAQPKLENPQLTRSPSFLQRLKSIKVSSLYRSDSVHGEKEPEPEHEKVGPESKMKESGSEEEDNEGKVAMETSETRWLREEEEVDAKADDFINRFRKQLRLQRVNSILRYRQMVTAN